MAFLFGGGMGGSTTSDTQVPAWLENAAIENINKARDVSKIGYTPYYGPDVAAFSPMQEQSMRSTGDAASAFGLAPQGFDGTAGIPQAHTFAGGVQGYSSAPLYQESVDTLKAERPAQYQAMADMFIDPFTGAPAKNNYAPTVEQVMQTNYAQGGDKAAVASGLVNSSDGAYYGVNDQYNSYGYSNPTEDISGDGVVDYRDMSFGEAGRRDIPWTESLMDSMFGGPARMVDGAQGLLFNASGAGDAPMTQSEALNQMNSASDRYQARLVAEDAAASAAALQAEAQRVAAAYVAPVPLPPQLRKPAVTTPLPPANITRSGGGSRAIGVNNSGAGRNQKGSTYSGGGKAARSGYGGISGGGGR